MQCIENYKINFTLNIIIHNTVNANMIMHTIHQIFSFYHNITCLVYTQKTLRTSSKMYAQYSHTRRPLEKKKLNTLRHPCSNNECAKSKRSNQKGQLIGLHNWIASSELHFWPPTADE